MNNSLIYPDAPWVASRRLTDPAVFEAGILEAYRAPVAELAQKGEALQRAIDAERRDWHESNAWRDFARMVRMAR